MELKDIMTTRVVTVNMDDKLTVVKEIFDHVRFHHLMVVEEEELIGVISDRDLLKEISPFLETTSEQSRDLRTLKKKAHQIMSRAPITARQDMEVREAASLLVDKHISCLPVVDEDNHLLGIVSWKDILKHTFSVG